MTNIEQKLKDAAEKSILKIISDGGWIQPDCANRIQLPRDLMNEVWAMVDRDTLKLKLKERIEQELADRIVNQIAAELSTDIKQVLSVPERREAVRAIARVHMTAIMKTENPQADHWQKAYNEMADTATVLMNALCEIRDKADPYTHQIHWCRQTASVAIEKANAALRPNEKGHR